MYGNVNIAKVIWCFFCEAVCVSVVLEKAHVRCARCTIRHKKKMNFHVYLGADTFKPKSNQTNRIQLYCMLLWPGCAHPENRMIYMRSAPVPVQILKNVFFSANEWVRRFAAILINYSRVQLRTHASLPSPVSNKCTRALDRNFYQVLWVFLLLLLFV